VIPTLLCLGFVVGLVASRLRVLAATVLLLGMLWGVTIAAGDGGGSFVAAAAVGTANAIVGAVVGVVVRLAFVESRQASPRT
jgi:hypothetical protein